MQAIHGGDIYRNRIQIDFSVNINPLGIPEEVKDALHQAVDVCMQYPDMEAEQLKEALSRKFCLPKTYFLPGNGASELFLGILHALKPKKVILPVPSFYGYAYAAKAVGRISIGFTGRCRTAFFGKSEQPDRKIDETGIFRECIRSVQREKYLCGIRRMFYRVL